MVFFWNDLVVLKWVYNLEMIVKLINMLYV